MVFLTLLLNLLDGTVRELLMPVAYNMRRGYLYDLVSNPPFHRPCMILRYRLSPLAGLRIGEAMKPGPFDVQFAVTNPTAVLNKADTLHSLGADVYLLSETSATGKTQVVETKSFRRLGLRSLWGHPVPTQLMQHRQADGFRGMATGVSCHTIYPGQVSRYEPTDTWETSGRFLQCFLKLSQQEIQVLILYGFPSCQAKARQRTN